MNDPNHLLVLGYRNRDDLPTHLGAWSRISAFGIPDPKLDSPGSPEVTVYAQLFSVDSYADLQEAYNAVFIRFPDPFGEPRNWLKAIYALGFCVDGPLEAWFYEPGELLLFDWMLRYALEDHVATGVRVETRDILNDPKPVGVATWQISRKSVSHIRKRFRQDLNAMLVQIYDQGRHHLTPDYTWDDAAALLHVDRHQGEGSASG